jgi:hypothetical protein
MVPRKEPGNTELLNGYWGERKNRRDGSLLLSRFTATVNEPRGPNK